MTGKVLHIGDEDFDKTIKGHPIVLVDFYAEWCGPCRMIAPMIEQIAEELANKVTVAKVDVDRSPGSAAKFGISSIPALLIFRRGQLVDRMVGAYSKGVIVDRLRKFI
jgi:thioredoxin 1